MSELTIYTKTDPTTPVKATRERSEIAEVLAAQGVRFEAWSAEGQFADNASSEEIIAAYRGAIDRIMAAGGYEAVDVIHMHPDHPDRETLREKFLNEHTHAEDEVRFFVAGRGLFTLHLGDRIYEVLCEQGDLISVPAGTPHWFDMGPRPSFTAIRIFTNPAGWVANFTGSDIASRFSRLEA